ncbi:VOC family protein [Sediminicola luteus]|uniref:Glyoxalase n=1 Tax=Sediminicola luteus TaxID=319238 RepID=A0A2A4G7R6_9FLAO|nr:VOC family protein [Sediminicola luteus]PCE64471.1 glyoxalase [Sediminicola luteus]
MERNIGLISLVVADYDEAIDFYVNKLGFELLEDLPQEDKRWVVVRPKGTHGASLLLAQASSSEQESRIGNQTGGRVFLFLYTDDFQRDYQNLLTHKVTIVRHPEVQPYGTVAVFKDLYGNQWDLIQPAE